MKNNFITSDFYTAAFLKLSNFRLLSIDKSDLRRFRFVFEDTDNRTKLLENFFAGRTKVEPRLFVAATKELKALMYSDALAGSKYER